MRLRDLTPDFIDATRDPSGWPALRDRYVLRHLDFLHPYHTSWVNGGHLPVDEVLADYQQFWQPDRAAALAERLAVAPYASLIEAAAHAPVAYLRPRHQIEVITFVGLMATSGFQMLVDGRPTIGIALEAWGDQFLGLPMGWADLPCIIAHEATHVTRYTEADTGLTRLFAAEGFDYGRAITTQSLLEFLVDEGLGVYLSMQILPEISLQQALIFQPEHLAWCEANQAALLAELTPLLHQPLTFAGYRRYFSAGDGALAPRCGYWAGWRLVSRFLAANPGIAPADAVRLPAEAFLPAWD